MRQMPLTINFSEIKVKVQGRNRHTENLILAINLSYFHQIQKKLTSVNLTEVILAQNNFRQNSRWRPDGGLHAVCFLVHINA